MAHSQWCHTLLNLLYSGRRGGELLYNLDLTILQRRIWGVVNGGDRRSLNGCVEYRCESWHLAGLLRGHGLCGPRYWANYW